jgi:hypothetical protein
LDAVKLQVRRGGAGLLLESARSDCQHPASAVAPHMLDPVREAGVVFAYTACVVRSAECALQPLPDGAPNHSRMHLLT